MCYPGTELWVPALYGMEIPDPEGSGLMVPILGMHQDGDSGATTPLAGTMQDAAGEGEKQNGPPQAPGDQKCGLVPVGKALRSLGEVALILGHRPGVGGVNGSGPGSSSCD